MEEAAKLAAGVASAPASCELSKSAGVVEGSKGSKAQVGERFVPLLLPSLVLSHSSRRTGRHLRSSRLPLPSESAAPGRGGSGAESDQVGEATRGSEVELGAQSIYYEDKVRKERQGEERRGEERRGEERSGEQSRGRGGERKRRGE
eukprot:755057-Hanusia_phi.AAC.1